MLKEIKQNIIKSIYDTGIVGEIDLVVPPKKEMGDLSFSCFAIAKEMKVNPAEAAKEIKNSLEEVISNMGSVEKVGAIGPYVNFFLDSNYLAENILDGIKLGYGKNETGKNNYIYYASGITLVHIICFINICKEFISSNTSSIYPPSYGI